MKDWSITDEQLGRAVVFVFKFGQLSKKFEESLDCRTYNERQRNRIIKLMEKEILIYAKKVKK